MSYGKMNRRIDIITTVPVKDDEGFVITGDTVLASVRAYKEQRHGNEKWANMAAFSNASALFRFRSIPGLTVDTSLFIADGSGKTTMIKLLCRLYDPTEGEIFLNGFNIKKYDYKEYS